MSNRFKSTVFASTARLLNQAGGSVETLMAKAKKRAADPKIFDEFAPVFFSVEASNNSLDAYYTRMAPSSLRNYAQDADEGRSFQDSHRHNALGLGATLSGQYIEEPGSDIVRVTADVFTLPGLPDQDAFLFKMRAGIARDVSIGFHGGDYRCSICGLDLWDWDCWHIPGLTYEKENRDAKGNLISSEEELAFAWIENARLSEVSIVYDGATPGCGILKAQQEVEAGRATQAIAERFSQAYRGLAMPGFQRLWRGISPAEVVRAGAEAKPASIKGESTMNKDQRSGPALPAQSPETATSPEVPETAPQTSPALQADGLRESVTSLLADLKIPAADTAAGLRELAALARDGQQYRGDLIDQAMTEGVRLMGDKFIKETYRAIFERSSLAEIKRIAEDWRAQADAILPAGRKTADDAQPEESELRGAVESQANDPVRMLPPSAFTA